MNTQPIAVETRCPFAEMGEHGKAMASAFATANDIHEVYACLRFHHRTARQDLFGWLDGCLFRGWRDSGTGEFCQLAFLNLHEMAHEWLEGR